MTVDSLSPTRGHQQQTVSPYFSPYSAGRSRLFQPEMRSPDQVRGGPSRPQSSGQSATENGCGRDARYPSVLALTQLTAFVVLRQQYLATQPSPDASLAAALRNRRSPTSKILPRLPLKAKPKQAAAPAMPGRTSIPSTVREFEAILSEPINRFVVETTMFDLLSRPRLFQRRGSWALALAHLAAAQH